MSWRGSCIIDSAGYIGDGKIGGFFKPKDGSFDYTPFLAPDGHEREFLAVVLAALTTDRLVDIIVDTPTAWSPVKWFLVGSEFR